MECHIQTMAGHWFKICVCLLIMSNAQVHGQDPDIVNLTHIQNANKTGAVCLDGSPGAYHYAKGSGEGANNWVVYLQGGGWCDTKDDCLDRRNKQKTGSTYNIKSTYLLSILSSRQSFNPDFYNWNRVFVRYCDGASFMADVEAVDPATKLYLRGARIFRGVMEELLAQGMTNANKAILAGGSAGGLATILNCDRFRSYLPKTSDVKCIADSGFFIHAKDLPGVQKRERYYHNELAKVLPTSCTSRMEPSLCLFPENLVGDIQTPLFLLNPAFDTYQIQANLEPRHGDESGWINCTLDIRKCTHNQLQTIKDFRIAFLNTLKESTGDNPSRGLFINSCFVHNFMESNIFWNSNGPRVENKTISQAIGDWYFDRSPVRLIDTKSDFPLLNCAVP